MLIYEFGVRVQRDLCFSTHRIGEALPIDVLLCRPKLMKWKIRMSKWTCSTFGTTVGEQGLHTKKSHWGGATLMGLGCWAVT